MTDNPESSNTVGHIAQVLLDSALPQLDHLFDYAVPDELIDQVRVGQRVRVPFRSQSRKSFGYVVALNDESSFGGSLQQIAEIVGPVSVLTPEIYALARALADRAGGSAGDILRLAIPQRMVRAEKQHLARAAATLEQKSAEGDPAQTSELRDVAAEAAKPTGEETHSGETHAGETGSDLREIDGLGHDVLGSERVVSALTPDTLAELLTAGSRLAITPSHGPMRLSTGEWVGGWAHRIAREALAVHATGHSVIIVAPDYRDIDQVRDVLEALGHIDTVRVDSNQSGSERYAHFLRALDPLPRIIIGNRSAVYAPAHKLGAILFWDDGDPVLSEPLSPYVHARDAALLRSESSGAGLLFAAHSRSAEVQRLIEIGYVHEEKFPPKRTRVVAADAVRSNDPFPGRVPEFAARIIRDALRLGPVLVQVATPGYAPITVCADCGDLARCTHCGGPLAVRSQHTHAACRWCAERAVGWRCESCTGTKIQLRGFGSERTAEQFTRQFSDTRVIVSDGAHQVSRVDSRSALVVATRGAEPLAAGGYRAVVLLDVERLLAIESLRASEDCLRWWSNAAALASPDAICVVASGGGPVVRAFVTGRIEEWVQRELHDRRALRYPPTVRVASVTGGVEQVERAVATLAELSGVEVLGPAPYTPRQLTKNDTGTAENNATVGDVALLSAQNLPTVPLQRAIVRFEYSRGAEVAKRLRGALVADAAGASSRVAGRAVRRARPDALRLRFDDRGVFDA